MQSTNDAAFENLIARYCAAWDETDPLRREQMLNEIWADEATYTDPTVHTVGTRDLVEHIGKVLARHPGSRIVRTSVLDAHHDVVRFTWKRVLADGTSLTEGIDFGEVDRDGRLQRIVGFFGPLAPI